MTVGGFRVPAPRDRRSSRPGATRLIKRTNIMYVTLAYPSRNGKTGPVATLTIERSSCPPACPLFEGCWAKYGPTSLVWQNVKTLWEDAMPRVARLPPGTLVRYGQAGDLPGKNNRIDKRRLKQFVRASRRLGRLIYTHYPVLGSDATSRHNRQAISDAIAAGCVINLSANNPAHADQLADLKLAPVTTIVAREYARRRVRHGEWSETIAEWRDRIAVLPTHTPAGRRLAVCPAEYADTNC